MSVLMSFCGSKRAMSAPHVTIVKPNDCHYKVIWYYRWTLYTNILFCGPIKL